MFLVNKVPGPDIMPGTWFDPPPGDPGGALTVLAERRIKTHKLKKHNNQVPGLISGLVGGALTALAAAALVSMVLRARAAAASRVADSSWLVRGRFRGS